MTDPSVPPGSAPEQPASSASGFFGWVRSLGIVRSDGWIGGVSSGVAVRIGIDPLIVRGLFVVLTLLGLPMVLLYALAWALLPDANGSIHLQNLFRGRFEAPMIAILIVVVLNFVPVIPTILGFGLWGMNGAWPYELTNGWSGGFLSVLLGIALIVLVVVAIVKISKNRSERQNVNETGPYAGYSQTGYPTADGAPAGAPVSAPAGAPAGSGSDVVWQNVQAPVAPAQGSGVAPQSSTVPEGAGAGGAAAPGVFAAGGTAAPGAFAGATSPAPSAPAAFAATAGAAQLTPPTAAAAAAPTTPPAPGAPAAPATAPGYDEWRRQHENWLGSNEQWRVQQADADKRAKEQARTEAIARGQELSRQASVQAKARRAANPRMGFGFVAAVVGVAVIAAAIVALLVAPQGAFIAATAALLVAGAIGGLGMALAGLLRRRSGFLTFLTVTVLTFAVPMGFLAAPFATDAKTSFALTSSGPDSLVAMGQMSVDGMSSEDREFVQFFGYTDVYVMGADSTFGDRGNISIVKGGGRTDIYVGAGTELDLEAALVRGTVIVYDQDPDTGDYSQRAVSGTTNADGTLYDVDLHAAEGGTTTDTQSIDIVQSDDVTVYLDVDVKGQN